MGVVVIRMVIKLINKELIENKKIELFYRIVDRESVIERKK